ncbi:MAG TPA: TIGR03118 family protein [Acidimicrobiia bacterium]|nr:TIGR03118 family protein [Acidimicrobiia bacterium]
MRRTGWWLAALGCAGMVLTSVPPAGGATDDGGYEQANLVANWEGYHAKLVEPDLQNAWGISLRPAGEGGHFWVTANGTGKSFEYIGDVDHEGVRQDSLKVVTVPGKGDAAGTPTGTVFNDTGRGFVITQDAPGGPITAPAKFLFCTDEGVVSAWTERQKGDGTFDRPGTAIVVADHSKDGAAYFGMALSPQQDKIFLANFGDKPGITVLDDSFKPVENAGFDNPFGGEFAPFNVQTVGSSVFVTYAEQEQPGEEEHGTGKGRLAEFTVNGVLVNTWDGGHYLNAPWGVTQSPSDGFGPFSGKLLVSNFGDGTIAVFDRAKRTPIDYLRRPDGNRVEINGLWGMVFGNGVSLGDRHGLYFAAGPGPETDGIFGRLTWSGR